VIELADKSYGHSHIYRMSGTCTQAVTAKPSVVHTIASTRHAPGGQQRAEGGGQRLSQHEVLVIEARQLQEPFHVSQRAERVPTIHHTTTQSGLGK
jgi:hypothetical protein